MSSFEGLILQSQSTENPLEVRHEAFGELVRRFQDMAFSQAFERLGDLDLAQDVAQDSFLTAYKNLNQLQHPRAFPSWLRRIVLTHCNRITRKKQHPTDSIEDCEHLTDGRHSPAVETEQRDLRNRLIEAIRTLPDHERIVTELYYLEGYSQNDISEMVRVPVKTVKSRLYSSRQRLQKRLHSLLVEEKAVHTPHPERVVRKTIQQHSSHMPTASNSASGGLLGALLECERLRIHIADCLQVPSQEYVFIEVPTLQTLPEPQTQSFGIPTPVLFSC